MRVFGAVLCLVLLAACGEGASTGGRGSGVVEYFTSATVLESPEHGPQLCFYVRESSPPQCDGADITNWSWEGVSGHESAAGTTWGDYALHGTYVDGALTLTREPADPETLDVEPDSDDEEPDLTTPCPEPSGGWFPEGRTKIGERDRSRAISLAGNDPSFGEVWVDQRPMGEPAEEDMNDPARLILNVRVTDDVAGMEARLREIWGGGLCVSLGKHTHAELRRITKQVNERAGSLLLYSSWGHDRVDLDVLVDEGGALQEELDAEFGAGTVKVTSALRAVPKKP